MTADQLHAIAPCIKQASVETFLPHLNNFMPMYGINTRQRIAAFIAQSAHESMCFNRTRELASGDAYEWRADLGNIYKNDGRKFKGRGLLEITGRHNYGAASKHIFNDYRLLDTPELLATPTYAVQSACWFWDTHNLNELADKYQITLITRKINGGLNGLAERKEFYRRALKVLAMPDLSSSRNGNSTGKAGQPNMI